jgi:glycosyltransferase involved in cell wall biosynthesis
MISLHHFFEDLKIFSSKNLIEKPLISVILPTYCRGDNGLLKRALDSVLSQTFQNFELIIVDDGSVDGTEKLVMSYIEQYSNVIYMRNYTNSGLPALRVNQGIEHARGEFICFQFDDDEWLENALETLYNFYISKNELCVVYGKVILNISGDNIAIGEEFEYYKLVESNRIANNSILIPRVIFNMYGMYDMHLVARRLCDWDLWLRFANKVPFYFCNNIVSTVYANQENSVGQLFPIETTLFRIYIGHNRNKKLKCENYKNYDFMNLSFIHNYTLKQKAFNTYILPWRIKNNANLKSLEYTADINMSQKKNILVTKAHFDSTIDITIYNLSKLLSSVYNFIFVPEEQLVSVDHRYFDYIIFHRTLGKQSLDFLERVNNIPTIYFIDDDLLNIYKIRPEFSYLAPGTEMHENLKYLIKNSDLVVTYSDSITKSIQPFNSKVLQLKTNILSKYLLNSSILSSESKLIDIAFIGGNARKEEIEFLWDILLKFATKYSNKIRFNFWGYIPEKVDELASIVEVRTEPFTTAYYAYLNKLQKVNFDIILSPLFDDEFRKGKSPIKLLEASAANALGVFSNSSVYDEIEHGITGIKVSMEADAWYEALESIMAMSYEERQTIIQNAKQFVLNNYSTENQLEDFKTIFDKSMFNMKIKDKFIVYACHSGYLAGAENHLFRHAKLMKDNNYNVVFLIPDFFKEQNEKLEDMCKMFDIPVVFCPLNFIVTETDNFVDTIRQDDISYFADCIKDFDIGLFHSSTIIPLVGAYARKLQIPYIASVYAVSSTITLNLETMPKFLHTDSVRYATRWGELLSDAYAKCIRTPLEDRYFQCSHKKESSKSIRFAIVGTLQERKGQLELIKALGELKQKGIDDIFLGIYGYDHFFEEYKKSCFEVINKYGLSEQVKFCGLVDDLWFSESIDCLVCASDYEPFPQVILEAMALKIPVVTTLAGGIGELIIDNYSGYVASGFDAIALEKALQRFIIDYKENNEKLHSIIENASKIVDAECRVKNVGLSLVKLYNLALDHNNTSKFTSIDIEDRLEVKVLAQKILPVVDLGVLKVVWLKKKNVFNISNSSNTSLSKIYFIPATNFKKFEHGFLKCTISNKNYPSLKIREIEIPLDWVMDNEWLLCEFEPINVEITSQLQIQFDVIGTTDRIAVYTNKDLSLYTIIE